MALTVIGVFDNASDAQRAVDELVNKGFSRNSVDLSAHTGDYSNNSYDDDTNDSKVGGFFGSLFGDDDNDTRNYTQVGSRGSIVTVHTQTDDEAERAADILDDFGAVDVNERAAQFTSGTTESGVVGSTVTDTNRSTVDNDSTFKVIEENLQVGKREVERGGVRIRSRIVERPVEENLRLREERVRIQRNPVNRPATASDLNAFQETQIEVTEHAEVPVVSKTANVVEEVSINKEVTEREEVIHDTVRRTDVEVEQINPTDVTNTTSTTRTDLTNDRDRNNLDSDDVTYSTR